MSGRTFGAAQIRLNTVDIIQQAVDPTAGGGVAAAIGSFFLRSVTAGLYLKTGAGNTAWSKLVQSFNWISVLDYGAVTGGLVDCTTAIQNALNDCNAQGGGVVYVPAGTYAVTQLTMSGFANVQMIGSGSGSIIKWLWNAANAAGSMITISGGSSKIRFNEIQFDGSGLTNPAASRANHLIQVGDGATAVTEVDIWQCTFGNMVAASGDGIHAIGAAGNLIARLRIWDNRFDGCSRFSIGCRQGLSAFWAVNNYLTNCETEIAFVTSADVNSDRVIIMGNNIEHTSGSVRHAVRLEGGATTLITKLICSENIILNGFATLTNAQYSVVQGNVQSSGAYASTDPVFRVFDAVTDLVFVGNMVDRSIGASAGICVTVEKVTASPTGIRIGQNLLINEISGGGFVKIADATLYSVGGNLCRNTVSAGGSTTYAIEVQAVTVAVTDSMIGPGNQMTALTGSYAGLVRLLANGANITDISVVGNQGDQGDYGLIMEVGGGGGTFNGQLLYGGNNFDTTVGDINRIGTTVAVRIGWNAGTFGPQLWSGSGSPEAVVTSRVSSMFQRTDGGQATAVYYKETGTGNAGWLGIGGSMITFGADNLGAGAGTVFLGTGYITLASAVEIQSNMTRPGTIRNLRVQVATAGTGAATITITVRKNGVDTALTTTIANTSTGPATDLAHSFAVVAGDFLSIDAVKGAGTTTGQQQFTASVELA